MLIAFASIFIPSVICVRSRLDQAFGYIASQVSHQQSAFANARSHTLCAARTSRTLARVHAHQSRMLARVHTQGLSADPTIRFPLVSTVAAEPRGFFPRLYSVARGDPIFSLFPLVPSIPCSARTCTPIDSTRPEYWCLSFPVGPQRGVAFVLVGGLHFG